MALHICQIFEMIPESLAKDFSGNALGRAAHAQP